MKKHFEISNRICVTKCEFLVPTLFSGFRHIGSVACDTCEYNLATNSEEQYVECTMYNKERKTNIYCTFNTSKGTVLATLILMNKKTALVKTVHYPFNKVTVHIAKKRLVIYRPNIKPVIKDGKGGYHGYQNFLQMESVMKLYENTSLGV